jgi:hypothetical protein
LITAGHFSSYPYIILPLLLLLLLLKAEAGLNQLDRGVQKASRRLDDNMDLAKTRTKKKRETR